MQIARFLNAIRQKKALLGSTTITEDSKHKYGSKLKIDYMSSDESAADSSASEAKHDNEDSQTEESSAPPKKKMLLTKKLPWRSEHFEEALKNLNKKSQRKRSARASSMLLKRSGNEITSARLAPIDAPRWAVKA